MSEMPASVQQAIDIVEDECFLNDFSPVEKTKSRKILWRVGNIIRDRIKASAAARCSADSASLRDALDNSQSLLVMIDLVGPDSASWIKEDMRDLLTKQIVENRTSLSDPKRAQPQAAQHERLRTVRFDEVSCEKPGSGCEWPECDCKKLRGTLACPICGKDTPHHHDVEKRAECSGCMNPACEDCFDLEALATLEQSQAESVPQAAIENLTNHQVQCDQDGVMIQASRQALDEVLAYVALTRPHCEDGK